MWAQLSWEEFAFTLKANRLYQLTLNCFKKFFFIMAHTRLTSEVKIAFSFFTRHGNLSNDLQNSNKFMISICSDISTWLEMKDGKVLLKNESNSCPCAPSIYSGFVFLLFQYSSLVRRHMYRYFAVTFLEVWGAPGLPCIPYPPKQQLPIAWITASQYRCLHGIKKGMEGVHNDASM